MCLDTLRAMARQPKSLEVLAAEIAPALGRHRAFDSFAAELKNGLSNSSDIETRARELSQNVF